MSAMRLFVCCSLVLIFGGCATIPSIPNDWEFPVNELARYTACELRDAYRELHTKEYPNFHATEYAISVELQPKADTEFTARAGLTGKSNLTNRFFNSWALGVSPGAGAPGGGYDGTGHQDGAVYYVVKSSALINSDKTHPLDCTNWSNAHHALVVNLQIKAWLVRTAEATTASIDQFTVDKHTFLAEITIQWDLAGAFTYNFPLGTDFATVSGRYKLDEALSVTITHEAPPQTVTAITLPNGGKYLVQTSTLGVPPANAISPTTATRLDLLQLQQSIQNLQINTRR
jgi:hypothetical protein